MGLNRLFICGWLILAAAGSMAQQPVDLVVRGASITIKVTSYAESQLALASLAAKHKGQIADKRNESSEKGKKNGWSRMYVPKAELDGLMADLRSIGIVYGEQSTLVDGTGEYADLGKRIERLQQHQQRLSGVLGSKRLRGSDILFIQERLLRAGTDQDTLGEQRSALIASARRSSVIVTVFEPSNSPETRGIAARFAAVSKKAGEDLVLSIIDGFGTLIHLLLWAVGIWIGWLIFRKPIKQLYHRIAQSIDPSDQLPPSDGPE